MMCSRAFVTIVAVLAITVLPATPSPAGSSLINSCRYLNVALPDPDPYLVRQELIDTALARGFSVVENVSGLSARDRFRACYMAVEARWDNMTFGSVEVSAKVIDVVSGTILADAKAGGRIWSTFAIGRTLRSQVKKVFDTIGYTGYSDGALTEKLKKYYPPRPKLDVTEDQVKARASRDTLEGIWTDPNDQFRLVIVKAQGGSGADYYGVVATSNEPPWEPGEIKAELKATALPTVFTASYYTADKKRVGTTLTLERDVLLRGTLTVGDRSEEVALVRVWPPVTGASGAAPSASATSFGTGFLVTHTGLIATNWHVVADAKEVGVTFPGVSELLTAQVVLQDHRNDLALLRIPDVAAIDSTCGQLPFQLAPSGRVALGQKVQTIGYPLQSILGSNPKYSEGVVSSKSGLRDDPRVFQISAEIQPGSSGSPLFDADGNVVGVVVSTLNAAKLFQEAGTLPQNVNWAVKSDYLLTLIGMLPGEKLAERTRPFSPDNAAQCVALIRAK